jgi:hypothetical protein
VLGGRYENYLALASFSAKKLLAFSAFIIFILARKENDDFQDNLIRLTPS